MKRSMGLAAIFVALSVSVPSYGYFLIYNVSCTVKGANNDSAASIPLKGYLVANLDNSNGYLLDANLIMYGKDSTRTKVYVQLDYASGNDPNLNVNVETWEQGPLLAFDIWDYNDSPFDFEAFVIGKWALKDIGLGTANKKYVATSLNGPISVWDGMLLDPTDEILGTGNVSATLYTAATKAVNTYGLTQDQIIVTGYLTYKGILQTLQAKGYTEATLP